MNRIKFGTHTGSWTNDDVDIIPTIKVRVGSKVSEDNKKKVKATMIALCWLKWAVSVSFGKVIDNE